MNVNKSMQFIYLFCKYIDCMLWNVYENHSEIKIKTIWNTIWRGSYPELYEKPDYPFVGNLAVCVPSTPDDKKTDIFIYILSE